MFRNAYFHLLWMLFINIPRSPTLYVHGEIYPIFSMRLWQYKFLVIQTYKTMADESKNKLVSKIGFDRAINLL